MNEKLTAYVLNELPPDERAELEAQMKSDPALRTQAEEMKVFCAMLSKEVAGDESPALTLQQRVSVMRAFSHEATEKKIARPFWRHPAFLVPAAIAACVAFAMVWDGRRQSAKKYSPVVLHTEPLRDKQLSEQVLVSQAKLERKAPAVAAAPKPAPAPPVKPRTELAATTPPSLPWIPFPTLHESLAWGDGNRRMKGVRSTLTLGESLDTTPSLLTSLDQQVYASVNTRANLKAGPKILAARLGSVNQTNFGRLVATTKNGSKAVTVSSTAGLSVGATVTGVGIPEGTRVDAILSDKDVELSKQALFSGTSSLTFSGLADARGASSNAASNLVFNGGNLRFNGIAREADLGFEVNSDAFTDLGGTYTTLEMGGNIRTIRVEDSHSLEKVGGNVVHLGGNNQVADSAIIRFKGGTSATASAGSGNNSYTKLMGFNETIGGITDFTASGVIENTEGTVAAGGSNGFTGVAGTGGFTMMGGAKFEVGASSGGVQGSGGLTGTGAGTLALDNGSRATYSGTTVNSMTLRVAGNEGDDARKQAGGNAVNYFGFVDYNGIAYNVGGLSGSNAGSNTLSALGSGAAPSAAPSAGRTSTANISSTGYMGYVSTDVTSAAAAANTANRTSTASAPAEETKSGNTYAIRGGTIDSSGTSSLGLGDAPASPAAPADPFSPTSNITMDSSVTIKGGGKLEMKSAAESVGSLAFANGGSTNANPVPAAAPLPAPGKDVSGRPGLVKSGAGTFELQGASTYTGGTTITAGTLVEPQGKWAGGAMITADSSFSVPGAISYTGGTIASDRGSLEIQSRITTGSGDNLATATRPGGQSPVGGKDWGDGGKVSGVVSGTANLAKTGDGSLPLDAAAGSPIVGTASLTKTDDDSLLLAGANTFTGTFIVNQGVVSRSDIAGVPASTQPPAKSKTAIPWALTGDSTTTGQGVEFATATPTPSITGGAFITNASSNGSSLSNSSGQAGGGGTTNTLIANATRTTATFRNQVTPAAKANGPAAELTISSAIVPQQGAAEPALSQGATRGGDVTFNNGRALNLTGTTVDGAGTAGQGALRSLSGDSTYGGMVTQGSTQAVILSNSLSVAAAASSDQYKADMTPNITSGNRKGSTPVNADSIDGLLAVNGAAVELQGDITVGAESLTMTPEGILTKREASGTPSFTNGVTVNAVTNSIGIIGGWATTDGTDWAQYKENLGRPSTPAAPLSLRGSRLGGALELTGDSRRETRSSVAVGGTAAHTIPADSSPWTSSMNVMDGTLIAGAVTNETIGIIGGWATTNGTDWAQYKDNLGRPSTPAAGLVVGGGTITLGSGNLVQGGGILVNAEQPLAVIIQPLVDNPTVTIAPEPTEEERVLIERRRLAEQQDLYRRHLEELERRNMEIARRRDSSNETYTRIYENPFLFATQQPLSTFSIDVDTASYANVRRFLNDGQLPPPDAVRLEELINYFPYSYEGPNDGRPFGVVVDVAEAPWQPMHRLVRVALKGREVKEERGTANFVFLVDVSGSMDQPDKLPLVQRSLEMLTRQLGANDRVAIVVYAGNSGLVLPSTSGAQRETILDAIGRLRAGGSTNGAGGITLAYQQAARNFVKGGVNRVILCTDGDFNVGISTPEELEKLIAEKAKSRIFLSVLGFGTGNLKDRTMETLADKGNGNYAYIDSLSEARKVLVEQMNGTLVTIAKDVKIQVEFNPKQVAAYRLLGYENRILAKEDFNNDKKDAGEIGSGHTVTALYEVVPVSVKFPDGRPMVDDLKYAATPTRPASTVDADSLKAQESLRHLEGERERLLRDRYLPDHPEIKALENKINEQKTRIQALTKRANDERVPAVAGDALAPASHEMMTVKLRYKQPEGDKSDLLEVPVTDKEQKLADGPRDFQFAASVAGFGMLLRNSQHASDLNWDMVRELALHGKGEDTQGYRGEFLQLIDKARGLSEGRR